jgi:hypothetical protein
MAQRQRGPTRVRSGLDDDDRASGQGSISSTHSSAPPKAQAYALEVRQARLSGLASPRHRQRTLHMRQAKL